MRILRAGLAAALLAAAPPAQAHEVDQEMLARVVGVLWAEVMTLHMSARVSGGEMHACITESAKPLANAMGDALGKAAVEGGSQAMGKIRETLDSLETEFKESLTACLMPPLPPLALPPRDQGPSLRDALVELDLLMIQLVPDFRVHECVTQATGPNRLALARRVAAGGAEEDAVVTELAAIAAQCYGSR